MKEKLTQVVDFIKLFTVGLYEDYKECWGHYPAVIVWSVVFGFLTGLIV
jgi:hypothetical protein